MAATARWSGQFCQAYVRFYFSVTVLDRLEGEKRDHLRQRITQKHHTAIHGSGGRGGGLGLGGLPKLGGAISSLVVAKCCFVTLSLFSSSVGFLACLFWLLAAAASLL